MCNSDSYFVVMILLTDFCGIWNFEITSEIIRMFLELKDDLQWLRLLIHDFKVHTSYKYFQIALLVVENVLETFRVSMYVIFIDDYNVQPP